MIKRAEQNSLRITRSTFADLLLVDGKPSREFVSTIVQLFIPIEFWNDAASDLTFYIQDLIAEGTHPDRLLGLVFEQFVPVGDSETEIPDAPTSVRVFLRSLSKAWAATSQNTQTSKQPTFEQSDPASITISDANYHTLVLTDGAFARSFRNPALEAINDAKHQISLVSYSYGSAGLRSAILDSIENLYQASQPAVGQWSIMTKALHSFDHLDSSLEQLEFSRDFSSPIHLKIDTRATTGTRSAAFRLDPRKPTVPKWIPFGVGSGEIDVGDSTASELSAFALLASGHSPRQILRKTGVSPSELRNFTIEWSNYFSIWEREKFIAFLNERSRRKKYSGREFSGI